ncbi:MAG: hypothetical protein JW888_17280 [Pirellulales bacterium]|nr:hypothetical protein [Pirellulales bacterium]
MEESGYPDLEQHQELHGELRHKTADLRTHVSLVLGEDLLRFLKDR